MKKLVWVGNVEKRGQKKQTGNLFRTMPLLVATTTAFAAASFSGACAPTKKTNYPKVEKRTKIVLEGDAFGYFERRALNDFIKTVIEKWRSLESEVGYSCNIGKLSGKMHVTPSVLRLKIGTSKSVTVSTVRVLRNPEEKKGLVYKIKNALKSGALVTLTYHSFRVYFKSDRRNLIFRIMDGKGKTGFLNLVKEIKNEAENIIPDDIQVDIDENTYRIVATFR